jgi:hypothetical protein
MAADFSQLAKSPENVNHRFVAQHSKKGFSAG